MRNTAQSLCGIAIKQKHDDEKVMLLILLYNITFFGSFFFFAVSASQSFHRMAARTCLLSYLTAPFIYVASGLYRNERTDIVKRFLADTGNIQQFVNVGEIPVLCTIFHDSGGFYVAYPVKLRELFGGGCIYVYKL